MSADLATGAGAPPAPPQPLREQVARLLVEGQGMDPEERVVAADHVPFRLPNGRKVLHPKLTASQPLWAMFVEEADRVIEAFGERTIEAALAMVRA